MYALTVTHRENTHIINFFSIRFSVHTDKNWDVISACFERRCPTYNLIIIFKVKRRG